LREILNMKITRLLLIIYCFSFLFYSCTAGENRLCINPYGHEITAIRSDHIIIHWDPWRNADSYSIEYGLEDFELGTGTRRLTVDPALRIDELQPNTYYEYYLRSNCSVGDLPEYNGPNGFLTLEE